MTAIFLNGQEASKRSGLILSTILRTHEVELEPAGMVLLGRFVTDGSSSPLFRVNADPRELEHELERIRRVLPRDGDDEQLAA